jgi:cytochrome c553
MAQIAKRLAPQDIGAISSWLASQPVPGSAPPQGASAALPMPCGGTADAASATSPPPTKPLR